MKRVILNAWIKGAGGALTAGLILAATPGFMSGCIGIPEGMTPVDGFDMNRYLGTWYEIVRLDHPFERGLERVSATYSLREKGGIRVVNKGFSATEKRWKTAEGKAFFVKDPTRGYLKVSFFGPFYGSYVIFDLDRENYSWAFVSGPDTSYLWLLARTPGVDEAVIERFLTTAGTLGFDTSALIRVIHDL